MATQHAPALSPDQQRALASLLDVLVPPDPEAGLPGAGELGVVTAIEAALHATPDLRPAVEEGLSALAQRAGQRGATGFDGLPPAERRVVVEEVAADHPAFLPGLIFHTYVNYYQHDRVVEALGMEARPPHPLGYALESGDLTLLEKVRRRGRLYREC